MPTCVIYEYTRWYRKVDRDTRGVLPHEYLEEWNRVCLKMTALVETSVYLFMVYLASLFIEEYHILGYDAL
jgi:hypothetical protein